MNKLNEKKLILLVEDEKILINTLEEKLKEEGFDVNKAYDGKEGLNLAIANHPDLILLDILMPRVGGLDMLKALRADPWGKNAKVIILTNIQEKDKLAESLDIGVYSIDNTYEYILKTDSSLENVISRIRSRLNINN